ncbi:LpxL/LpxP family Kdo(2)-lipid IV(A) lauroyl/palmitoleoyl acyltransferase [Photobacterium lutimaris]|uniref:Lipid A biosynthesis acyltransferase n=1 Tax=Photobacterium lutimaris TaxID=388278 RepID=A0A2T3J0F5_9GAMM|nr:LpxL/LpxP family Kdo(2)-lipid IV(A) lauroyl/palmitoleoyl acyltransferase [Photobacterium lutimaris]PSU34397.1 lipid A biosynthesis lauroyl acyltransferase [Photobacterium lutimaris]TDR76001.1 KDO2-lipid IV(A) lauroyltransferase [Photobacterium lutimaris]
MSKFAAPRFSWNLLSPRYWPTLILIVLMYLLSCLPYVVQRRLGQGVGRLAMGLMKKRRFTIERNLELCFPEMTENEKKDIVKKNIDNSGLALFETGMAWFWSDARVKRHVRIEGMEHIEKLEQEGKGALFVAVHSLNLELAARAFGIHKSGTGIYRPNNNPCFDFVQYRGRARSNRTLIDRKDVKGMLKALSTGARVWYAPDHDYGRRRSTFAPLFAVEKACTTTGTSLLVDNSGCEVMTFRMVRETNSGDYVITIAPLQEEFPRNDPEKAAVVINRAVENAILAAPCQYMWLHRRFKTRPEGEPSLYSQEGFELHSRAL